MDAFVLVALIVPAVTMMVILMALISESGSDYAFVIDIILLVLMVIYVIAVVVIGSGLISIDINI